MFYFFFTGDSEIKGTQARSGNMVSNQIAFLLKPDDNEADYRCNATNVATTNPLLSSIRLTIHCKSRQLNTSTTQVYILLEKHLQKSLSRVVLNSGYCTLTTSSLKIKFTFFISIDNNSTHLYWTVNLSVPPQSLDISTSPIEGRVGQKLVVTCKSATSNPPSELSWWKDGDEIEGWCPRHLKKSICYRVWKLCLICLTIPL